MVIRLLGVYIYSIEQELGWAIVIQGIKIVGATGCSKPYLH